MLNCYVSIHAVKKSPVQDTNKNDIRDNTCVCGVSPAQLPHTVLELCIMRVKACHEFVRLNRYSIKCFIQSHILVSN